MARAIKITRELLDAYVQELDIPLRLQLLLESRGIDTVMDLMYCCGKTIPCKRCEKGGRKNCEVKIKLMEISQFGKTSLEQIFRALEEFNNEQSPRP